MFPLFHKILSKYLFWGFGHIAAVQASARETNSQIEGRITTDESGIVAAATVTAIHESTNNIFVTKSRADGYFHLFNLKPGGPYTIGVIGGTNVFSGFCFWPGTKRWQWFVASFKEVVIK